MAHIVENLVLEALTAAIAATDDVPLAGAVTGYRAFSAVCASGDTVHYCLRAVDIVGRPTGDWEIGRGQFVNTSGVYTLKRTAIFASSNAGSAVAFAEGFKHVSLASIAPSNDQARTDILSALRLDLIGQIAYFAINTPPAGWLKANGAAVSRTAFANLFSKIGTTFGAGNGTTTFNLPDGRGEFLRGWDDARGIDSSRVFGSWQDSVNKAHNHGITDSGHAHSVYDPGHAHSAYTDSQGYHQHGIGWKGSSGATGGFVDSGSASSSGYASTDAAGSHAHNVGIYAAATSIGIYAAGTGIAINQDGLAEARPRNLAMLCCIRY